MKTKGLVTIPTDKTFAEGTKKYIEMWGADAVRDCDGVTLPDDVGTWGVDVYKAYFIVREDRDYAEKHHEYLQNIALISDRATAFDNSLEIDLLKDFFKESVEINEDRIKEFWQVFDRTTGELHNDWEYLGNNIVRINNPIKYHEYTVNFFVKNLWDPVQIYNYHANNWNVPHDIGIDPIYPEALEHMLDRMESWCKAHPEITVVRFTTFFYNFMILYKTGKMQTYWDWHTYAMTASPAMFDAFEREHGYKITLEDVVTSGTYGSRFKIPAKKTREYIDFVQKLCCGWAKQFVDIAHKYGKKTMMFDGDHRIGTEPYNPYFATIGLDAVVGAPHSGPYIRLLSDMTGIKYTEGRLNPYFFPNECPSDELGVEYLTTNWNSEKRGMLKKPIDRIGFGGYLKQVDSYPNFVKLIANVCNEFRTIRENAGKEGSHNNVKVAILNYWGRQYSWMQNGGFTDDTRPETNGYQTLYNAICGQPVDVSFISFDDVLNDKLSEYDVVINTGLAGSAFQGDFYWNNPVILSKVREYVANGGGFLGIGDPTAFESQGRYFQLGDVLGVEKEIGFTYAKKKYFPRNSVNHWIVNDINMNNVHFGNQGQSVYPLTLKTDVIASNPGWFDPNLDIMIGGDVYLSANSYGKGRAVYICSLKDSYDAFRLIYKALLWAGSKEENYYKGLSTDVRTDCYYYPTKNRYAVLNNVDEEVSTTFYDINGNKKNITLKPHEILWIK